MHFLMKFAPPEDFREGRWLLGYRLCPLPLLFPRLPDRLSWCVFFDCFFDGFPKMRSERDGPDLRGLLGL